MSGLGIWKVVPRRVGDRLRWMVTRNGEDMLEEPMIFKGQAVRTKTRMMKVEGANVRDATLASYARDRSK